MEFHRVLVTCRRSHNPIKKIVITNIELLQGHQIKDVRLYSVSKLIQIILGL